VEGQLIWLLDGSRASGVGVELWPDPGSVVTDTLRVRSNGEGIFRIRVGAPRDGEVAGTLVFFPPEPYHQFVFGVPGIRVRTTRVRGSPSHVGNWGVGPVRTDPHISYVGELFFADSGQRAADVEVQFRRTGGIGARPDTFTVRSNDQGRFPLFTKPIGEGELVGELEVRPSPPYRTFTIPEVRLQTLIGKDDIRLIGVWAIEP
jgi:hypothetical protein